MPQMSPMMWMIISISFLAVMSLTNMSMKKKSTNHQKINLLIKNSSWKW
uniref:ATP synthase F0 subunit 8 n=1 Tax=Arrenurus rostratus TaxID=3136836 RepID=A0AAU6QDK5_9ACAR